MSIFALYLSFCGLKSGKAVNLTEDSRNDKTNITNNSSTFSILLFVASPSFHYFITLLNSLVMHCWLHNPNLTLRRNILQFYLIFKKLSRNLLYVFNFITLREITCVNVLNPWDKDRVDYIYRIHVAVMRKIILSVIWTCTY